MYTHCTPSTHSQGAHVSVHPHGHPHMHADPMYTPTLTQPHTHMYTQPRPPTRVFLPTLLPLPCAPSLIPHPSRAASSSQPVRKSSAAGHHKSVKSQSPTRQHMHAHSSTILRPSQAPTLPLAYTMHVQPGTSLHPGCSQARAYIPQQ